MIMTRAEAGLRPGGGGGSSKRQGLEFRVEGFILTANPC